jgi:hypothetical protein
MLSSKFCVRALRPITLPACNNRGLNSASFGKSEGRLVGDGFGATLLILSVVKSCLKTHSGNHRGICEQLRHRDFGQYCVLVLLNIRMTSETDNRSQTSQKSPKESKDFLISCILAYNMSIFELSTHMACYL